MTQSILPLPSIPSRLWRESNNIIPFRVILCYFFPFLGLFPRPRRPVRQSFSVGGERIKVRVLGKPTPMGTDREL